MNVGGHSTEHAFDRDNGMRVDPSDLRTYAEALSLYSVSTEDKFKNGGPNDTGPTIRRHLRITGVGLIGKEANQVGDAGEANPEVEAMVEFGRS